MNPTIKLAGLTYGNIRADLRRHHLFAFERVGFLFARSVNLGSTRPVLLARQYTPVPDQNYIKDSTVGARIDAGAIRTVRARVMEFDECAFHVHAHLGPGVPRLSRTDIAELPPVIESFVVANPNQAHGLFLLSEDSCSAHVWMPGPKRFVSARIIIVGTQLQFFWGESSVR